MKMFPKVVLEPLLKGFIEMRQNYCWKRAKPNEVKLSQQNVENLLLPFLKNIADLVSLSKQN